MKMCTLKYRGAFALAAKIAGLLPYGAFALWGFCPTTSINMHVGKATRVEHSTSQSDVMLKGRPTLDPHESFPDIFSRPGVQ